MDLGELGISVCPPGFGSLGLSMTLCGGLGRIERAGEVSEAIVWLIIVGCTYKRAALPAPAVVGLTYWYGPYCHVSIC